MPLSAGCNALAARRVWVGRRDDVHVRSGVDVGAEALGDRERPGGQLAVHEVVLDAAPG